MFFLLAFKIYIKLKWDCFNFILNVFLMSLCVCLMLKFEHPKHIF